MSAFTPKPKILASVSGGRTSWYMAQHLKREYGQSHEIIYTFANTGQENEPTLIFNRECAQHFGIDLVWLEAVVNPERMKGTTHTVVTYETASRAGQPFEDVIKKYGIPNKGFPHCTRELKANVMESYARSLGWEKRDYTRAIGIRADEIDRMNPNWEDAGLWYPLVNRGITKNYVLTWFQHQPVNLHLREHHGNCKTCWKKSDRKLWTLAKENPGLFDFFDSMEKTYPDAGAETRPPGQKFFRRHRSVQDVLREAQEPFQPFVEENQQYVLDAVIDAQGSCGDSCEPWADEEAA